MAEARDIPPSPPAPLASATRREEALKRRAEALRENLKRRKAQARVRKAGAPAPDPEWDGGESA